MIPGIKLLNIALGAIASQTLQWYKFAGNTTNDLGQDIPSYDAPVTIIGSFQPVDARAINEMGLNTAKQYRNLYTSNPLEMVKRETSPDYAVFMGRKYEVAGDADWYAQDGWKGILFVDVGPV